MTGLSNNVSSTNVINNKNVINGSAFNSTDHNGNANGYTAAENLCYSYETIKEIADFLLEKTQLRPKIGIICGSGLNSLADRLENTDAFPYEEIPYFPISTVEGHVGRMVFGYLNGVPVMCMQGRFHYYEGYPLAKCSMPVRVMKLVGVTHLLATNAAGGLNPKFKVGDIMIVRDHINMMGFAGNSPLQGPNDSRFGPRFPPMAKAYSKDLIKICKRIIKDMGSENDVHEGVYTCLGGPNYETVAELKMLRTIGVDAVGMSTVHEVLTAKHCDITAFAFSLITNKCSLDYDSSDEEANHEEVVSVGQSRQEFCGDVIYQMVRAIHDEEIAKDN
ncbi:purine nucleoside phosphorylase isoform X3 [Condylostylus longicornis]|uniref:purine nucleoside phosphorylase isoform X3 n=1 Tax=Condylostylus longicornis TaxID=2530218 RepID=UPI00244E401A|nr:purine nucleoside phosphorylase isoform X3 [Condylostylus longicornis]